MIRQLGLVCLMIAVCAGPVLANQSDKHHKHGHKHDMIQTLNLSREQVKEIRKIRRTANKDHEELRVKLEEKMFLLHEELSLATPNEQHISEITGDITFLKKQLLNQRVKTIQMTNKILSAEQREQLKELRKERIKRRHGTRRHHYRQDHPAVDDK